jgi:hypothetical protein
LTSGLSLPHQANRINRKADKEELARKQKVAQGWSNISNARRIERSVGSRSLSLDRALGVPVTELLEEGNE